MKLHFFIFFICSVAEGCRGTTQILRSMKKIPRTVKSRFKGSRITKDKVTLIGTSSVGVGLVTTIQRTIQYELLMELIMTPLYLLIESLPEIVQAIQMLHAPEVCKNCFHEFEKILEAVDEKANFFCEKIYQTGMMPEWYDAKNKKCTADGALNYYEHRSVEVLEIFGAENNKCLRTKSEYWAEIKKDSKCREGHDRFEGDFLRCIYDIAYQPEEAKKSCKDYIPI